MIVILDDDMMVQLQGQACSMLFSLVVGFLLGWCCGARKVKMPTPAAHAAAEDDDDTKDSDKASDDDDGHGEAVGDHNTGRIFLSATAGRSLVFHNRPACKDYVVREAALCLHCVSARHHA